jgi:hypothetical protein
VAAGSLSKAAFISFLKAILIPAKEKIIKSKTPDKK